MLNYWYLQMPKVLYPGILTQNMGIASPNNILSPSDTNIIAHLPYSTTFLQQFQNNQINVITKKMISENNMQPLCSCLQP